MKQLLNLVIMVLLTLLTMNSGIGQKNMEALKIDQSISIDGKLDEGVWKSANGSDGFTVWRPNAGDVANKNAEVKILYDDEAIYVGAFIEEIHRDSIMQELTQRDDLGNTDWFGLFLDSYQSGNNALEFIVGATGVQFDAKLVEFQNEDPNWDAVWFSEVHLTDNGWSVEIKLPYSALRFPKADIQTWNINFIKKQARTGEVSTWNTIDPTGKFFLTQSGILTGIKDIKPPFRLSLSPYFSAYIQNHYNEKALEKSSTGFSYNGGLDLKYGINDAFTLDMTLIPDFGQVQSDDKIVNLSPYEVRFDEQRPFFTEGVEIFNKGNLFYSRRVGGRPINMYAVEDNLSSNEEIVKNPSETQLYNATKLSGRSNKGLGVGFFNAVSADTYATIRNTETGEERFERTSPLTNYNVFILDQNLKNNSTLSLINTSVIRQGSNFYDANVTATAFDFKNKKQSFSVNGNVAVSQLYYEDQPTDIGYRYNLYLDKITGNFNFGVNNNVKSKNFNSNDLGFNRNSNINTTGFWANYSLYEEFWKYFSRLNLWFNAEYARIMDPNVFTGVYLNGGFWAQTKKFWEHNVWLNYIPKDDDYFEPRTEGWFVDVPVNYNGGYYIGTDGRKKFKINASFYGYNVEEKDRNGYGFNIIPRYRFSDKFTASFIANFERNNNEKGWVDFGDNDEIIFGTRKRDVFSNVISAEYTMSDKMGITLRVRHYWTKVMYSNFEQLNEQGLLNKIYYDQDQDFNYDQFNIDLNYRWRFAPGSDIFLVWKNNIAGSKYNEENDPLSNTNYLKGLEGLSQLPQDNSLSLRVVYYMDYNSVMKKVRN